MKSVSIYLSGLALAMFFAADAANAQRVRTERVGDSGAAQGEVLPPRVDRGVGRGQGAAAAAAAVGGRREVHIDVYRDADGDEEIDVRLGTARAGRMGGGDVNVQPRGRTALEGAAQASPRRAAGMGGLLGPDAMDGRRTSARAGQGPVGAPPAAGTGSAIYEREVSRRVMPEVTSWARDSRYCAANARFRRLRAVEDYDGDTPAGGGVCFCTVGFVGDGLAAGSGCFPLGGGGGVCPPGASTVGDGLCRCDGAWNAAPGRWITNPAIPGSGARQFNPVDLFTYGVAWAQACSMCDLRTCLYDASSHACTACPPGFAPDALGNACVEVCTPVGGQSRGRMVVGPR